MESLTAAKSYIVDAMMSSGPKAPLHKIVIIKDFIFNCAYNIYEYLYRSFCT